MNALKGAELEEQYKKTLEELGKQNGLLGEIFKQATNKISNAAILYRVVQFLPFSVVTAILAIKIAVKVAIAVISFVIFRTSYGIAIAQTIAAGKAGFHPFFQAFTDACFKSILFCLFTAIFDIKQAIFVVRVIDLTIFDAHSIHQLL